MLEGVLYIQCIKSMTKPVIIYCANIRYPTEKAHGIQTSKMCEAFVRLGFRVTLVVPRRINDDPEFKDVDPMDYYGITVRFPVIYLPTIDLIGRRFFGRFAFVLQSLTYAMSIKFYLLFRTRKNTIVYSRELETAYTARMLGFKTVFEAHNLPSSRHPVFKKLVGTMKYIIAISHGLRDDLLRRGIASNRVLVAADGVDLSQFSLPLSRTEARDKLGWPQDKTVVLYTGHLYEWKGVYVLADSAKFLSKDVEIIFVGGTESDSKKFESYVSEHGLENVKHVPLQPPRKVPEYLSAADVVIVPNSGKHRISRLYTSPIKLFEYMASRRPIVATRLPSVMEILDNSTAQLVHPDNSEALAAGIKAVLINKELAGKKVQNAWVKVQKYTWDNRARTIIDFIQ